MDDLGASLVSIFSVEEGVGGGEGEERDGRGRQSGS